MSFSEISRRWKTEKAYIRQQAEDMPYNENKPEIQKITKTDTAGGKIFLLLAILLIESGMADTQSAACTNVKNN